MYLKLNLSTCFFIFVFLKHRGEIKDWLFFNGEVALLNLYETMSINGE